MSEPRSIAEPGAPAAGAGEELIIFQLPEECSGQRQDKVLATLLPEHSRARLQDWIAQGRVLVDGRMLPAKARMEAGMRLQVRQALQPERHSDLEPQPIEFPVLYEDEDLLVINKPAGLTVHPGAGQADQTLQNGLLHYRPQLAGVARAGIVHRLDKATSGLMVVAATAEAQTALVRALQAHEIQREYRALVWGVPVAGGRIDEPLGRHPRDRLRFAVRQGGREAVTHYRVLEKFPRHSLLAVKLETGRTHQIRVHMEHQGYPLIGDPLYGRRGDPYRRSLGRQALHACALSLRHPRTGAMMHWEAPLPQDLQEILDVWRGELD